jgi:Mg-chelatase subunit ChlD
MGWASDQISSALWVLGQAVSDSGGVSVGAVFGGKATLIFDSTKHKMNAQVMDFSAHAGTEAIADCLVMVNDALNLATIPGSVDEAVVVVISDGVWVDGRQNAQADKWLAEASSKGVRTVLVGLGGVGCATHPCDKNVTLDSPEELVPVLGKALIDVLKVKK